jgi:large subunit ribosomal protein L13
MIVYDADGQILGRLCSIVAKQLLKGESVIVVNAEKAVISGSPKATKEQYAEKVRRGDPYKGPFFPRMPDAILRRTVRGMLPWHKPTGRKVYKKLKVFIGVPGELTKEELKKVDVADAKRLKSKSMTLGELSLSIGGKKRW